MLTQLCWVCSRLSFHPSRQWFYRHWLGPKCPHLWYLNFRPRGGTTGVGVAETRVREPHADELWCGGSTGALLLVSLECPRCPPSIQNPPSENQIHSLGPDGARGGENGGQVMTQGFPAPRPQALLSTETSPQFHVLTTRAFREVGGERNTKSHPTEWGTPFSRTSVPLCHATPFSMPKR